MPMVPDGSSHWAEFESIALDSGQTPRDARIAYRTYGPSDLRATRTILVCHALTGDQFVAEPNPITRRPGWWEIMVGPGKAIDTDKYHVVCSNILGGCMGSTGPESLVPGEERQWRLDF